MQRSTPSGCGTLSRDVRTGGQRPAPTVRTNVSWMLVGSVTNGGLQFGTMLLISRLASVEALGHYALALAIVTPIMLLFGLHLRGVQATDAKHEYPFRAYLRLRGAGIVVAAATIALIGLHAVDPTVRAVLWSTAMVKMVESLADVYYGHFQLHERMDWVGRSTVIRAITTFLFLSVALISGQDVATALALAAVGGLIVHVSSDVRYLRRLRTTMDTKDLQRGDLLSLGRLALFALPLGITMVLVSVEASIPRFFISAILDAESLGAFSGMVFFATAGRTLLTAFGQALAPRMARAHALGDSMMFRSHLLRLSALAVAIGAAGVGIAVIVGDRALVVILGQGYADMVTELLAVMAASAAALVASAFGYGLTAARKFAIQAPIYVVTIAALTIAAACLIPLFGVLGAALSMLIASISQATLAGIAVQRSTWSLEVT